MGRSPCCDKVGVKKGPWTPEEDEKLVDYIHKHGHANWKNLPQNAGLNRCGKSCRLRWTNYLRPDIKRGKFSEDEERLIIHLHSILGNKWSTIATRLPGRTDNEIKNYWNTHLRKKLLLMGIDPVTHRPKPHLDLLAILPPLLAAANNLGNLATPSLDNVLRLQADAANLARFQILQNLIQLTSTTSPLDADARSLLGSTSLQNYQSSDLLQMNHHLEGLMNGSLSLPQNQIPVTSGLSGLCIPQLSNTFQAHPESSNTLKEQEMVTKYGGSCSFTEQAMETKGQSAHPVFNSCGIPTARSTPSLVSTSPEHASTDQKQDPINSTASTPFEDWGVLNLDGPDNDLSWKDFLDQISRSNASS